MSQTPYTYTNNREYRHLFRTVIGMENISVPEYLNDEDEETLDEMNYDNEKVEQFMTNILENTKENSLFIDLYEKASALMISNDIGIGLAILLSYDYFCDFYPLYVFFEKQHTNIKDNIHYQTLVCKLST
jgi:monomeric isocitrate dehydrogenase